MGGGWGGNTTVARITSEITWVCGFHPCHPALNSLPSNMAWQEDLIQNMLSCLLDYLEPLSQGLVCALTYLRHTLLFWICFPALLSWHQFFSKPDNPATLLVPSPRLCLILFPTVSSGYRDNMNCLKFCSPEAFPCLFFTATCAQGVSWPPPPRLWLVRHNI